MTAWAVLTDYDYGITFEKLLKLSRNTLKERRQCVTYKELKLTSQAGKDKS